MSGRNDSIKRAWVIVDGTFALTGKIGYDTGPFRIYVDPNHVDSELKFVAFRKTETKSLGWGNPSVTHIDMVKIEY